MPFVTSWHLRANQKAHTMNPIKLPAFVRLLNDTYGSKITYGRGLNCAISGTIPAKLNQSGTRWMVDPAALPLVAEALGLTKSQTCA
jgi:hypothetical protein